MASTFAVTIWSPAGDEIHLRVPPSDTVWTLKELLSMEIGRPPGCMQLIYCEEILHDDSKSLDDQCVADGAELTLILSAFPLGTFLLHDPMLDDKEMCGCDATLVRAVFWNDGTFEIQIREEGGISIEGLYQHHACWEQVYSGRVITGRDDQLFLSVSRCEQWGGSHLGEPFDYKPEQLLGEYGQNEDEIRLQIPYATLSPYPCIGQIEERWDTLQRISAEPVSHEELQGLFKRCDAECGKRYHIACMKVADKPSACNHELHICQVCCLRDRPAFCHSCELDMDDGMAEATSKRDVEGVTEAIQ